MTTYYETLSTAVLVGLAHKLPKRVALSRNQEDITWDHMDYETTQRKSYDLDEMTLGENMGVKPLRKQLNISIYRMPSGRYEVTSYIG